jgi:hypothetical protein
VPCWPCSWSAELSRRFQLHQGTFISSVVRAMVALTTGHIDQADQLYETELAEHIALGSVEAELGRVLARTTLRYTQGRLHEMTAGLDRLAQEVPVFPHALALALAESGDLVRARSVLAQAPPLNPEMAWQLFSTMHPLRVAAVADEERADGLYDELLPFEGQVAVRLARLGRTGPDEPRLVHRQQELKDDPRSGGNTRDCDGVRAVPHL